MATATLNAPTTAPVPVLRSQRLFTGAEYQPLVALGIIKATERCHLVRGLIVRRNPINPPPAAAVRRATRLLTAVVSNGGAFVQGQLPITLADSQPHPDLAVVLGSEDDYAGRHPGPREVLLVVELADSSLPDDKAEMCQLSAENKLPVYWLVNIPNRQVEVSTLPRGGKSPTYRGRVVYGPGQSVPVVLVGQTVGAIPVSELLP